MAGAMAMRHQNGYKQRSRRAIDDWDAQRPVPEAPHESAHWRGTRHVETPLDFTRLRVREVRRPRFRRTDADIDATFAVLKDRWLGDTSHLPGVMQRFMHPAYQQIIGLGAPVVTTILNDLRFQTNHWFWALNALVGHDAASGAQTPAEAAALWIAWGEREGYLD